MNLQNPNHLDVLVINGDNNYLTNQNTSNTGGTGYWNAPLTQNRALGANPVVPVAIAEAIYEFRAERPTLERPNSGVPLLPTNPVQPFSRQSLLSLSPTDLRQVNPTVTQLSMASTSSQNASVSVTSPEIDRDVECKPSTAMDSGSTLNASSMDCKVDMQGDLVCGEID